MPVNYSLRRQKWADSGFLQLIGPHFLGVSTLAMQIYGQKSNAFRLRPIGYGATRAGYFEECLT
jgi:hypothetical protein